MLERSSGLSHMPLATAASVAERIVVCGGNPWTGKQIAMETGATSN
jgi:hypothetical protein